MPHLADHTLAGTHAAPADVLSFIRRTERIRDTDAGLNRELRAGIVSRIASAERLADLAATAAERRTNPGAPTPDSIVRLMDAAADAAADSGHIDHTPGGSPDPYAGAAPATPTAYAVTTYKPRAKVRRAPVGLMEWREAYSRCRAAARTALGESFSDAERDDCQSHLVEWLAERVPGGFGSATFPAEHAEHIRLVREAGHFRRSLERARNRTESIEQAHANGYDPHTPDPGEPVRLTRYAAADAAAETLSALGADPTGALFPLAYRAHRERGIAMLAGTDGASDIIARELGFDPTTGKGGGNAYRLAMSRATGAKILPRELPSAERHDLAAHLAALAVDGWRAPDSPVSLPANFDASTKRTDHGAAIGAVERAGTRIKPGDRTPNAASIVPAAPITERTAKRTATVAGRTVSMRPTKRPAAWTKDLAPRTVRRLDSAAKASRKATANRPRAERDALRLAAGLSPLAG